MSNQLATSWLNETTPHIISNVDWSSTPLPDATSSDADFVRSAGYASRDLPQEVYDRVIDFLDDGHHSGAMLLKGVPIGDIAATPESPLHPTDKDARSEFTLLTVARRLGQPVGYLPEHGGDLVQNIVPIREAAQRQISTSSQVELMFHTEATFHPHRPRYLLLICLRGDPAAGTTLTSVHDVLPHLSAEVIDVLFQNRFRTAVDESYLHGRHNQLGEPLSALSGTLDAPTLLFDMDLMVGMDPQAEDALKALAEQVQVHQQKLVLEAGDLLIVDNNVAVHGRTPFSPRFDGTDRWLQRTFVVNDLAASAGQRAGRVINTVFGRE